MPSPVKVMPRLAKATDGLYERSGSVTSADPLVRVFYAICLRHMPTRLLAEAVRAAAAVPSAKRTARHDLPSTLAYGLDCARRLYPTRGIAMLDPLARCFAYLVEHCFPVGDLEQLIADAEGGTVSFPYENGWIANLCIAMRDELDRGIHTEETLPNGSSPSGYRAAL